MGHLMSYLVKTKFDNGLTEKEVKIVIRLLNLK